MNGPMKQRLSPTPRHPAVVGACHVRWGTEACPGRWTWPPSLLASRVCLTLGEHLDGRCIAVWCLAFKPQADDVRDVPPLALVLDLSARDAKMQALDPMAGEAARQALGVRPGLQLAASALQALFQADALVLVTDWPAFAKKPAAAAGLRRRGEAVDLKPAARPPLLMPPACTRRRLARALSVLGSQRC